MLEATSGFQNLSPSNWNLPTSTAMFEVYPPFGNFTSKSSKKIHFPVESPTQKVRFVWFNGLLTSPLVIISVVRRRGKCRKVKELSAKQISVRVFNLSPLAQKSRASYSKQDF